MVESLRSNPRNFLKRLLLVNLISGLRSPSCLVIKDLSGRSLAKTATQKILEGTCPLTVRRIVDNGHPVKTLDPRGDSFSRTPGSTLQSFR
jgi:hypothetical protein